MSGRCGGERCEGDEEEAGDLFPAGILLRAHQRGEEGAEREDAHGHSIQHICFEPRDEGVDERVLWGVDTGCGSHAEAEGCKAGCDRACETRWGAGIEIFCEDCSGEEGEESARDPWNGGGVHRVTTVGGFFAGLVLVRRGLWQTS